MKIIQELLSFREKLLPCILELIFGIVLLISPEGLASVVFLLLGILLLVRAVVLLIRYFRADVHAAAASSDLTEGLLFTACGLYCILDNGWMVQAFPLLTSLYGLIMLLLGLSKIQWTVDQFRLKQDGWKFTGGSALLTILLGTLALVNPFGAARALSIFIAISMILSAAADIAVIIMIRKLAKPALDPDKAPMPKPKS